MDQSPALAPTALSPRKQEIRAFADRMAAEHLAEVERKIAELEKLREALNGMVNCCAHTVAECRIIDALAS